jgi:hypothetical protein
MRSKISLESSCDFTQVCEGSFENWLCLILLISGQSKPNTSCKQKWTLTSWNHATHHTILGLSSAVISGAPALQAHKFRTKNILQGETGCINHVYTRWWWHMLPTVPPGPQHEYITFRTIRAWKYSAERSKNSCYPCRSCRRVAYRTPVLAARRALLWWSLRHLPPDLLLFGERS